MGKLTKEEIKDLLDGVNIFDVVSKKVKLTKRGSYYVGRCPFHSPDIDPSFKILPRTNRYKCYSCEAQGDAIEFLMAGNASFTEACDELRGGPATNFSPSVVELQKAIVPIAEWRQVMPSEMSIPEPVSFDRAGYGTPYGLWRYHDENGQLLGFVVRFDRAHKKYVFPYVYAKCITEGWIKTDKNGNGIVSYHKPGDVQWNWSGFDKPRPLYNLHLLIANPEATVLMVEGEKCADAAQTLLDPAKTVVMAWLGGVDGVGSANWSPLAGRWVMMWPDHDVSQRYKGGPKDGELKPWNEQPGNKAMLHINGVIKDMCPERQWITIPDDFPDKFDVADGGWSSGDDLRAFIEKHRTPVPGTERPTPQKIENPPVPPRTAVRPYEDNGFFRSLGYERDEAGRLIYCFFSYKAKSVIKLSPSAMNRPNLKMLADQNWWEGAFPGNAKSPVSLDGAQQALISACHDLGIFASDVIRGRGIWKDGDDYVIHTGNQLIVWNPAKPDPRRYMPLNGFSSKYVYEIGKKMEFKISRPLESTDSKKVLDKVRWMNWERPVNAYLAAGWAVIAPFCGILRWRPHIWVTGPASSGKTQVIGEVFRLLLAENGAYFEGKSSEAGIRSYLGSDALAVVLDEADARTVKAKENLQQILDYIRLGSSSAEKSGITKATPLGGNRTSKSRGCFCLLSIGLYLDGTADRGRFSVLGLGPLSQKHTTDDTVAHLVDCHKTFTDEYVSSLHSRTMQLLPIIFKSALVFKAAIISILGDPRFGDQIGIMLAAAWSLTSSDVVSEADAKKFVNAQDWSHEKGMEFTKDEDRLFSKIFTQPVRVEVLGGTVERSIGELVLIASGERKEYSLAADVAEMRIRRLGIMVVEDKIYVVNQSPYIRELLKSSDFSENNYNELLRRLPGARSIDSRRYSAGLEGRGVSIPLPSITAVAAELPADSFGPQESPL